MSRNMISVRGLRLCAAGFVFMWAQNLSAQTMTVLEQDRSLSSFIILPSCGDGAIFLDDEAVDFGLFDSKVVASDSCPTGLATALTIQQSTIGETELAATGLTASDVASEVFQVIHAISATTYEVTFMLDAPASFQLSGEISASGAPPVVLGGVGVLLLDAAMDVVTVQSVEPEEDGGRAVEFLDQQVSLEPGVYTFRISANTVIDSEVPPDGAGDSFFDVTFALITSSPDLDGDGDIDFADLLALLDAWGECTRGAPGSDCPADLDSSGSVGFGDLLILLAAWS